MNERLKDTAAELRVESKKHPHPLGKMLLDASNLMLEAERRLTDAAVRERDARIEKLDREHPGWDIG